VVGMGESTVIVPWGVHEKTFSVKLSMSRRLL